MCSHRASVGFYIEAKNCCYKTSVNHSVAILRLPWDLKLVIIRFQDRLCYYDKVSNLDIKFKEN